MDYRVEEIIRIVKGSVAGSLVNDCQISEVLTDSRKLADPQHTVFFALTSRRNDGHKYIEELYHKGVRTFIISNARFILQEAEQCNFILVKNTLAALQALARAHREKFAIPVIGITGSNGKTIIKEWLYQLIGRDKKVVRSPRSYNSQIGVPLSVLQTDYDDELAIFEAGISEPDEMDKLAPIIKPGIGIFTNIGEAHSENFISLSQKIGEKLKLFTRSEVLIYCLDHPEVREIIGKSGLQKMIRTFTWSRKVGSDLRIIEVTRDGDQFTLIRGTYLGQECHIRIPFQDEASIENAIHCWSFMLYFGYSPEILPERFEKLAPIAMRLELKDGINYCTIINDSYSSDINSLAIAIDFLRQQANHKKKTIILSDILQSGKDEAELYSLIAEILHRGRIDRIIGIGSSISRQADKFNAEKVFFASTADFLRKFSFSNFHNEVILLKGARIFAFEQISQALQQKTHETVLEIDLDALVRNLNHFKTRLDPGTKIMAMVKAFSYGIGSYEIANALQFNHIDYLAVAYADEGVELRKAGITVPVMVMNPDEQSLETIMQHDLEPEIYSLRILGLLEKTLMKNGLPDHGPVKIHIKLDTGMHRLGFVEEDLDELCGKIRENKWIRIQSVFSHLAASEDPSADDFTKRQFESFERMSWRITEAAGYPCMRHILNSAGIVRFPEKQLDMVRLGISLYGIAHDDEQQKNLEPVGRLRSVISQVKAVRQGEPVGYNLTFIAPAEMRIGIVPIGYADGLSRILSNGRGKLLVGGSLAPIVGLVSMDMCMIDITGLEVAEGDEVIVFGPERPIRELARDMETIPYEVLTSISKRVKRIYYRE
jgi:alanine racemase